MFLWEFYHVILRRDGGRKTASITCLKPTILKGNKLDRKTSLEITPTSI
jgi:hypothetical protein